MHIFAALRRVWYYKVDFGVQSNSLLIKKKKIKFNNNQIDFLKTFMHYLSLQINSNAKDLYQRYSQNGAKDQLYK